MMQFLIAAPSSGSGKTTVACAVLAALKKRGADPCAFKSGPDYIDPMFHRSALQVDSHNLDLFLSDRPTVQALYARCAASRPGAGGNSPKIQPSGATAALPPICPWRRHVR
jgi:cobyrinic acid a,c-diamide synthase